MADTSNTTISTAYSEPIKPNTTLQDWYEQSEDAKTYSGASDKEWIYRGFSKLASLLSGKYSQWKQEQLNNYQQSYNNYRTNYENYYNSPQGMAERGVNPYLGVSSGNARGSVNSEQLDYDDSFGGGIPNIFTGYLGSAVSILNSLIGLNRNKAEVAKTNADARLTNAQAEYYENTAPVRSDILHQNLNNLFEKGMSNWFTNIGSYNRYGLSNNLIPSSIIGQGYYPVVKDSPFMQDVTAKIAKTRAQLSNTEFTTKYMLPQALKIQQGVEKLQQLPIKQQEALSPYVNKWLEQSLLGMEINKKQMEQQLKWIKADKWIDVITKIVGGAGALGNALQGFGVVNPPHISYNYKY